jgi:hypothetical protein
MELPSFRLATAILACAPGYVNVMEAIGNPPAMEEPYHWVN